MIIGDFNIDTITLDSNKNKLVTFLNEFGLRYLISEPTRVTPFSCTCIDNIFVNDKLFFKNKKILCN